MDVKLIVYKCIYIINIVLVLIDVIWIDYSLFNWLGAISNVLDFHSSIQVLIHFVLYFNRTDPDVIYVSIEIPEMSLDDFYGAGIIDNFAAFFGIADANIRVASYQGSSSKRDATVTVSERLK